MHEFLTIIIPYITGLLDLIGVFIVTAGAIKAVVGLLKNKLNLDDYLIKLNLAKSLELGLEFKLGAEILKTVVIQTLDEIAVLGAVVILRVIMTFVIHWEIKNAE